MKHSISHVLEMLDSDLSPEARKWRVAPIDGYNPTEVHDGGYNVVIDATDGQVFVVAENYSRGDCTLISEATEVMDNLMTAFKTGDVFLAGENIRRGRELLDNSSIRFAVDNDWFAGDLHDEIPSLNIQLENRVALLGDGLLGGYEEAVYIGAIPGNLEYMMSFVALTQIQTRQRKGHLTS